MVVLQQLNLSIEESHNANDGNAKGGGEEHFVEHLFLLVSDPGLGHMARICSLCNRLDWSENWPTRLTKSDPLRSSRSQQTQLITDGLAVTSETFKALKFSPSQTVANFFLGNPVFTCDFASSKCRHLESELIQDVRAPQSLVSINSGDQDQLGSVFCFSCTWSRKKHDRCKGEQ